MFYIVSSNHLISEEGIETIRIWYGEATTILSSNHLISEEGIETI